MTDVTGVRLRDGVEITLSDGSRIVADAAEPDGDVAVLSHAHGDHLFEGSPGPVVCSAATADLARVRRDAAVERTSDPRIELVPSGHVAGSRAALINDPDGTTYCYTGDCTVRDRWYLSGFEPPDADVLVIEATYGDPDYRLPSHESVAESIHDWLTETDGPVLLFGYALGRAQKLQVLANDAGRDVFVSDAIAELSAAMEQHVGRALPGERYDDLDALGPGDAAILPSGVAGSDWVARLADRVDATTAGFSGWAVDDSFRYRGGYDRAFPLSDHCDFDELVSVVERVDPDRVYTHHGAADTLASELTTRGYDATALARNQHTLGEFG